MRLLLDTHIFIWWADEPERLESRLLQVLMDSSHDLFLSVASLWEMQIKAQLGKLQLKRSLQELITVQQRMNGIQLLPILPEHVFRLEELPAIHKDPFDRIIIAQAMTEELIIATHDRQFDAYPVSLWRP